MFWPEQDEPQGFAYLRNALWEIRTLLGEKWLDVEGKNVRIRTELGAWIDTQRFESIVGTKISEPKALQEAIDLYRADFLAGFTLRGSLEFDNWQTVRAEELRLAYDRTLEKLVANYITGGELDTAVAIARRRVELDPLNECAQRTLIELLARSGQRARAIRQFEACQGILKNELDLQPEQATFNLYQKVCSDELAPSKPLEVPQPVSLIRTGNLPAQTQTFIGRARELGYLSSMLSDPNCRLATIVGMGGVGKTSLALKVARENARLFPDGVWFIPLASLDVHGGIMPAIAETLQVLQIGLGNRHSDNKIMNKVCEYLHGKKALLVLDNFEHLLSGADVLHELVNRTMELKLLITSRERLNLLEEWGLEIAGLPVPGDQVEEQFRDNDAVQLFLASARRVRADFEPTGEDWPAIWSICRQVEGLPLGLELAASWVRAFSCKKIAQELETTFDFLYSTQRGLPERQRSLHATFDYTWSLLEESERAAFRRLAIFMGGFDRQAAAQVTGVPLSMLTSLIDKSLLRRDEESRFSLHPVLQYYALEKLSENREELKQVRTWHSEYFLNQLTDWLNELKGGHQIRVLQAAWLEHANLLAAWDWAIEQSNITLIRNSVIALTLVIVMRGQYSETLGAFEKAIRLARKSKEKALLAFLLAVQHNNYITNITPKKSEVYQQYGEEALKIIQKLPASFEKAYAQILLARGQSQTSIPQQSEMCQQSANFLQTMGDEWGAAIATLVYADLQGFGVSNYSTAMDAYQHSLKSFTKIENDWGRGMCMYGLAHIALANKEYESASQLLQECCRINEKTGDLYRLIEARLSLAHALISKNDKRDAKYQLELNIKLLEKMGWKDALAIHQKILEQLPPA